MLQSVHAFAVLMGVTGQYRRVDGAGRSATYHRERVCGAPRNFVDRFEDTRLVGATRSTTRQNQGGERLGTGHAIEYTGFWSGWYTPSSTGTAISVVHRNYWCFQRQPVAAMQIASEPPVP